VPWLILYASPVQREKKRCTQEDVVTLFFALFNGASVTLAAIKQSVAG
jgi:hypothetical protein